MRGISFVSLSSPPSLEPISKLRLYVGCGTPRPLNRAVHLVLLRRAFSLLFFLCVSLAGQADDSSSGSLAAVQSAQTERSSKDAAEQMVDQNLRARLRMKYQWVDSLTSQVSQVKSSRFLSVPLRSTARLEWSNGRVLWKTLKPVPSEVLIADGTIRVTDAGGTVTDLLQMKAGVPQASVQPVLAAVLSFLQRLFAFDFVELERDFSFVESGNTLKAAVRPGAPLHFFRSFTLAFDETLTLEKLELEEASGTTEMVFTDVQIGTRAH